MAELRARAGRVSADEHARRRYVEAYAGPWDAADALAWAVEPGATSPSGRVDPRAELARLEVVAFGRPESDGGDSHDMVRAWEKLARQVRANEFAVEAALGAALNPPETVAGDVLERDESAQSAPTLAPTGRWWRSRRAVIVTVVIFAVVGVAAVVRSVQPSSSLAIFDRPQTDADVLVVIPYGMGFVPGSVRVLQAGTADGSSVGDGTADRAQVFVYQTNEALLPDGARGGVCLAIRAEAGASAACTSFDRFRETGIRGVYGTPSTSYSYSWGPTGNLEIEAHSSR